MSGFASSASPSAVGKKKPTLGLQLLNIGVFHAAWFGAVVGAARQHPLWGTAGIGAAVAWHLAVSARPVAEARLIASVAAIGLANETLSVALGFVRFPSGQPVEWLAPYWMVALWALLGIGLNVTMRWLKRRPWLAAAVGAVAGPLSFVAGVQLGGAVFVDKEAALASMAVSWALLLPLLMALSQRFDGVAVPAPTGDPREQHV